MIFDAFEQDGLLLNMNFKESAGKPGFSAYRGDLVLQEGEIGDAAGRRKPPVSAMRQVVALANEDKLTLLIGSLDQLDDVPVLLKKYAANLTSQTRVMLFVINAAKDFQTSIDDIAIDVVSLPEGAVWTELCETLGLEKGDFKGQSAGEKVMTIYSALLDHRSKSAELAWTEAQSLVTSAKRQIHGAI